MRRAAIVVILFAACGEEPFIAEGQDELRTLFSSPGPAWPMNSLGFTDVPVCWVTPGWASEKNTVRTVVEAHWGGYSTVRFLGWGDCNTSTPQPAIRIAVADVLPNSAFGPVMTSTTMTLNFTYDAITWWYNDGVWKQCRDWDRHACIRSNALHEFGHALGYSHEHEPQYGSALTVYDESSIMSYYRPFPYGTLTVTDIMGFQRQYGLADAPATMIRTADGRLEVFARFTDNAIWRRYELWPNGSWSPWESLGGDMMTDPAVGMNLDGRLELFATSAAYGKVQHKWQLWPGGPWSAWTDHSNSLYGKPVVGRNADGRLEVFVRRDSDLYHSWQVAPNSGWSGYYQRAANLYDDPVVATNADGRMIVFARVSDGSIHYTAQTVPNGGWSSWVLLGGQWSSSPTVERDTFGMLWVFARGKDRSVYTARQTAANSWSFTPWGSIGGVITGAPMVGRNADGRLEVFARGQDNALWHNWQWGPGSTWVGWYRIGGSFTSSFAVGNHDGGRLEVIGRGFDLGLYTAYQTAPNGGWAAFGQLGGTVSN